MNGQKVWRVLENVGRPGPRKRPKGNGRGKALLPGQISKACTEGKHGNCYCLNCACTKCNHAAY